MMIGRVDTTGRNRIRARMARIPSGACPRTRLRGQALILFMVALLVIGLGVIVLFNTGQTVSKKVELVNAADAAAYSAAIEQARAYNLIAYMNRAEVANEVAVAQIVTIYSMTNYLATGTDTLRKTARDISYALYVLAIVTEGATLPAARAFTRAERALGKAKQAIVRARNGMQKPFSFAIKALSWGLNRAYAKATNVIATLAPVDAAYLAKQVVDKNTDGEARIGVRGWGILTGQFAFAEQYITRHRLDKKSGNAAGADRFANVVMEARDGFSRDRSEEIIFGAVTKGGGTDVVTSSRGNRFYDSWVAADTLNFYVNIPWPLSYIFDDIDLPLAWGAAAAVNRKTLRRNRRKFRRVALSGYNHGKGWDSPYTTEQGLHIDRYGGALDNHAASKKALRYPAGKGARSRGKEWLTGYVGLRDYDDIAHGKATVPYLPPNGMSASQLGVDALNVGPKFTVAIEQPINTVRTSSHIDDLGGPPDFEAPDAAVQDRITAISTAQVYFSRPRGFGLFDNVIDSRREMGSLFSPYWQARLVETPCKWKMAVAASYGSIAPCNPLN